jgi:RNA polymerase sigma-70 factor (ECF subfamily)
LPDGYRLVVNLYLIDGYNHLEIAEMLNITEGTSKSQLSRARNLLKRELLKIGYQKA